MKKQQLPLWKKEDYLYPVSGAFLPNVMCYLHEEDSAARPAILVVPGGGYRMVSCTEGENVALEFYGRGYNAFVLTYTTNVFGHTPVKFQPMQDLSRAVLCLRKNAEKLHLVPHQLILCGFSAGAHLCGSLAVHFDAPELKENGEYSDVSNRPDALLLSYPVITSSSYAHKETFLNLLGENAGKEELDYMSLEKQVTEKTPPVFLWHTVTDEQVPMENSLLFFNSLRSHNIPTELHLFASGKHGLSLANEAWGAGVFHGNYVMEQLLDEMQVLLDRGVELPAPYNGIGQLPEGSNLKQLFGDTFRQPNRETEADPAIALWPELADQWLKNYILKKGK